MSEIADGLRKAVGSDTWLALPLVVRLRIVAHIRAALTAPQLGPAETDASEDA
jgi:hypothetical protein